MFKLVLEKAKEPEIKLPTSVGPQEKQESSKKKIYFCFNVYTKAFDSVDHNKLENSSRDGNNRWPYLPPEKFVCRSRSNRTRQGTIDGFQIGKGVCKGCILSPCLFNLYAKDIRRNAGLEETQLESKLPGEISITSDMQMTPPLWQKVKRN